MGPDVFTKDDMLHVHFYIIKYLTPDQVWHLITCFAKLSNKSIQTDNMHTKKGGTYAFCAGLVTLFCFNFTKVFSWTTMAAICFNVSFTAECGAQNSLLWKLWMNLFILVF